MTEESPDQARNDVTLTQEQYAGAYSRGFRLTVRFMVSRGIDRDTAEEAAQAAWVRGWERRRQLRNPQWLLTWVNAIALNEFRNGYRRRRASEIPPEIPIPPQTNLRAIDLRRVLEKCKPAEREMLEKHYLAGYTSKELAEQGDCTDVAVRVRLLRIRRRIREKIEQQRVCGPQLQRPRESRPRSA